MDTNKLENKDKGQTIISDQSHRLIESDIKKYRLHCQTNDNTNAIKIFPFVHLPKTTVLSPRPLVNPPPFMDQSICIFSYVLILLRSRFR